MYSNEWDREGRILHYRLHHMMHALKHTDREMSHALKNSLAYGGCHDIFAELAGKLEQPGPTTIEDILSEIDGSISYLEDLQAQKLLPYEEKLDRASDRIVKLKESLRK
jgi:hypothetical protein